MFIIFISKLSPGREAVIFHVAPPDKSEKDSVRNQPIKSTEPHQMNNIFKIEPIKSTEPDKIFKDEPIKSTEP